MAAKLLAPDTFATFDEVDENSFIDLFVFPLPLYKVEAGTTDFLTPLLITRALFNGYFQLGTLAYKSLFSLLTTFVFAGNSFTFCQSRETLN